MPELVARQLRIAWIKFSQSVQPAKNNMNNTVIKIVVGVAYAAMVAVNYLANALPFNNRSTGAIADAYPNIFAPAGLTFSIWGLIYLLLGAYMLYQFMLSEKDGGQKKERLLRKVKDSL